MSRPWMPLYIGDYLADTRSLTTLAHGAYLLLIMEYWQNDGLPQTDAELSRIAGLTIREWLKIKPSLEKLFKEGWRHKRIDEELAKSAAKSKSAKDSAGKRWRSDRNANAYANAYANALPTHMPTQCVGNATTVTATILDDMGSAGARDPADLDQLETELRTACGEALDETQTRLMVLSTPRSWLKSGADLKFDVLPVLRALSATQKPRSVRSWAFFTQAIADARERRLQNLPPATPPASRETRDAKPDRKSPSAVAFDLARQFADPEPAGKLPDIGRG